MIVNVKSCDGDSRGENAIRKGRGGKGDKNMKACGAMQTSDVSRGFVESCMTIAHLHGRSIGKLYILMLENVAGAVRIPSRVFAPDGILGWRREP